MPFAYISKNYLKAFNDKELSWIKNAQSQFLKSYYMGSYTLGNYPKISELALAAHSEVLITWVLPIQCICPLVQLPIRNIW